MELLRRKGEIQDIGYPHGKNSTPTGKIKLPSKPKCGGQFNRKNITTGLPNR